MLLIVTAHIGLTTLLAETSRLCRRTMLWSWFLFEGAEGVLWRWVLGKGLEGWGTGFSNR